MKSTRIVCTALAAALGFGTVAQAQPSHQWRGEAEGPHQQQQWRGEGHGQQRWQRREAPAYQRQWQGPAYQQRWQAPAYQERHYAPRYEQRYRAYNDYAPRSYAYGGYYAAPRAYYGPSYYVGGYAPAYVAHRYWINDWRARNLYAPPYGYQWVETDAGDVLLVALATGLIANAILAH